MAIITDFNVITDGDIVDANQHRENFNNIQSQYNYHDRNKALVHGVSSGELIGDISYYETFLNAVQPVGSVIATWDNSDATLKAIPDTTNYWAYMDGQTISDVDSPFDGVTLPDLTEAMVTFSGTVSSSLSGEYEITANNHKHLSEHSHTMVHSHTLASHSHADDTTWSFAKFGFGGSGTFYIQFTHATNGHSFTSDYRVTAPSIASISSGTATAGVDVEFVTSSETGHTCATDDIMTTTLNYGDYETTYDDLTFKPLSIKVRYLVRFK